MTKIFVVGFERRMCFETECVMALQGHLKTLILALIESVCDILLDAIVAIGPILPRFRDIAGFLLTATPPLFHPNFKGIPLEVDCRCCGSEETRP